MRWGPTKTDRYGCYGPINIDNGKGLRHSIENFSPRGILVTSQVPRHFGIFMKCHQILTIPEVPPPTKVQRKGLPAKMGFFENLRGHQNVEAPQRSPKSREAKNFL